MEEHQMPLDFRSLKQATEAMDAVLAKSLDVPFMGSLDDVARDAIRSGVIQHFEFTYELCWKFIQRWLNLNHPGEDASLPRSRKDLYRLAARHGLIADPSPWFEFGDARNLTAHTYDRAKAALVHQVAAKFLPEAQKLLAQLEAYND
jgi:nucleotidyltransferase substrate binding protein (TIGR01987 family)